MVTKEWGFAGATCHVTGQDREPASWNDLFISGLPVRPDGWVRFLCHSVPQVISQTDTDEQPPPYIRTYSLERIARAFGVPIELLSQTTTEAN